LRIVGFTAHPDDAEIYFCGLAAAARAIGHTIELVVATDGARGGMADPDQLRRTRRREAEESAALLEVKPRFLDLADGSLSANSDLTTIIEQSVIETRPHLVVTHSPNDYHPDHRALSSAVRAAVGFRAPILYADTMLGVGFEPMYYVDITPHFELKRAAIGRHQSQKPDRLIETCEIWNRFRSLQCNALRGYAEAFRVEPAHPFADIRAFIPPPPVGDGWLNMARK
jgi:LmbE family N-acetylglucosaminyl deacetylase